MALPVAIWSRCGELPHAPLHIAVKTGGLKEYFERKSELEAGRFYPLNRLDGCLTFRIIFLSWYCLKSFFFQRLATP